MFREHRLPWSAASLALLPHSLKPASYTIRAEAAGYEPAVRGPHRVTPDEQRRSVEIPLERE